MAETKVGMELSFHRAAWTQLKRQGHSNTPHSHPKATLKAGPSPTPGVPRGGGKNAL